MALPAPYQWTFRPQTYSPSVPLRNPGFSTSVPSINIPRISRSYQAPPAVRGPRVSGVSSLFDDAQTTLGADQNLWGMVRQAQARQAATTPVGGISPDRVEQTEAPVGFGLMYNKPNLTGPWAALNTPLGILGNIGIVLEGPKNVLWGGALGLGASTGRATNRLMGIDPDWNAFNDPALQNSGKIYEAASHTDNPFEAIWKGMSKAVELSRQAEYTNYYNDMVSALGLATTGLDTRPTNKLGQGFWYKSDGSGGGTEGLLEDIHRWTRQGTSFIGNIYTDPVSFVQPTAGPESLNASKGVGGTLKDLVAARRIAAATAANVEKEAAQEFAGGLVRGAVRETADGLAPQAAQVGKAGAAAVAENNAVNAANVLGRHGAAGRFNSALDALDLAAGNELGRKAPRSITELMQTALEMASPSTAPRSALEAEAIKAAEGLISSNATYRTANIAAAKTAAEAGEIPWAEVLNGYYRNIAQSGVKKLAEESEEQFAARVAQSGQNAMEEAISRTPDLWDEFKPFLSSNATDVNPAAMNAVDDFVTYSARDASRLRLVVPFSNEGYNIPGGEYLLRRLPSLRQSQRLAKYMGGFSKFKADQAITGSRVGAAISQQMGYMSEGVKQVGTVKGDLAQEAFYAALQREAAKLAESRTGLRKYFPNTWSARRETRRLGGIVSLLEQKAMYHGIEFGDMELDDWVAKNIKQTTKTIDGAKRYFNYHNGTQFANPEDGNGFATKEEAVAFLRERLEPLTQTLKNQVNKELDEAVASSPASVVNAARARTRASKTAAAPAAATRPTAAAPAAAAAKEAAGEVAEEIPEKAAATPKYVLARAAEKDGKVIFPKGTEILVVEEKKDGKAIVRLVQKGADGVRHKFGEGATLGEAIKNANSKKSIHIIKNPGAIAETAATESAATAVPESFKRVEKGLYRSADNAFEIIHDDEGWWHLNKLDANGDLEVGINSFRSLREARENAADSISRASDTLSEATESSLRRVKATARPSIDIDDIDAFKGDKRLTPKQLKDATRQRVRTVFRYGEKSSRYYFRKEGTKDTAEWVVYSGGAREGGKELFRRPGTSEGYKEIYDDVRRHFADSLGFDVKQSETLTSGHVKVISGPKMFAIDATEGQLYGTLEPSVEGEKYGITRNGMPIKQIQFDTAEEAEKAVKQLEVINRLKEGGQLKYLVEQRSDRSATNAPSFYVAHDVVDDDYGIAQSVLAEPDSGVTIRDTLTDDEALALFGFEEAASSKNIIESADVSTITAREGSSVTDIPKLTSPEAKKRIERRLERASLMLSEAQAAKEAAGDSKQANLAARRLERAEKELASAKEEKLWFDKYVGKDINSANKWAGNKPIKPYDNPGSAEQTAEDVSLGKTSRVMKQRDIAGDDSVTKEAVTQGDIMLFTGDSRFAMFWDGQRQRWVFRAVESVSTPEDLSREMIRLQNMKGVLEETGKVGGDQYARVLDDIDLVERKIEMAMGDGTIVNFRPGRSAFLDRDTVNNWLLNEDVDTSPAIQQLVDRNKITAANLTKKPSRQLPASWLEGERPLVSANTLVEPSPESISYEQERLMRNLREFENTGKYDALSGAEVTSEHGFDDVLTARRAEPGAADILSQSTPFDEWRKTAGNDDEFVRSVIRSKNIDAELHQYAPPPAAPAPSQPNVISYEGQRLNWYDQLRKPDMGNTQDDITAMFGNRTAMRGNSGAAAKSQTEFKTKLEALKRLVYSGELSTTTDWKGDHWIPNIDPTTGNVVVTIKNNVTGEFEHFGTFQNPEAAAYYVNSQTGRAFTGGKSTMFFNDDVVDRKLDDILTSIKGSGLDWNYTESQVAVLRKAVRDIANAEYDIMGKMQKFEREAGFGGESVGAYVSGEIPRRPIPRAISDISLNTRNLNRRESTALYEAMGLSPEQIAGLNTKSKELYKGASKTDNKLSQHFLGRLGVTSPVVETGVQAFEESRALPRLDERALKLGYGMELNMPRRIGHRVEMGMVAAQQDEIMKVAGSLLGREIPFVGQDESGKSLFSFDGETVNIDRLKQLAQSGGLNNIVVSHDGRAAFSLDKFTKEMIEDALNPGTLFDDNSIMQGLRSISSRFLMPLMTIMSPSFTVNNLVGNIEHSLLSGRLTPSAMYEAGKDITDIIRMARHGDRLPFTMSEVGDIVFDNADESTNRVMKMMASGVMTPASQSQQLAELNGLEAKAGVANLPVVDMWMNHLRKLNNVSENYFRSAVYHSAIESGMSEGAAIGEVNRVMLDYYQSSLTKFERTIRYFVPFYTFSRRNIPYTAQFAASHPGMANNIFNRMPVEFSNLGTDEEGRVITPNLEQYLDRARMLSPSQRQYMGQTPIFSGGMENGVETGEITAYNPKLTFTDTMQWLEPGRELAQALTGEHRTYTGARDFQPFWDEARQQGVQSLNPVFKMILEASMGTDIETGNAIDGNSSPERTMNAILGNIPIVGQGVNAVRQVEKAKEAAKYTLNEYGEPVEQPVQGNPDALYNFIQARFASQYPRKINAAANNKQWEFYAREQGDRLTKDYEAVTGNQLPGSAQALQNYIEKAPTYSPLASSPDFQYRLALVDQEYNAWKQESAANRDSLGYNPVGNSSPPVDKLDRWLRILYSSNPNESRALLEFLPPMPVQAGGLGGGISQTMDNEIKMQNILQTQGPEALMQYLDMLSKVQSTNHNIANSSTYGAQMFGGR